MDVGDVSKRVSLLRVVEQYRVKTGHCIDHSVGKTGGRRNRRKRREGWIKILEKRRRRRRRRKKKRKSRRSR